MQNLDLLGAMITPAVLISAAGTLILSTSNRLARIVDRVRTLTEQLETLAASGTRGEERRQEVERQLRSHAARGHLVQLTLTSFYVALGMFVAATAAVGVLAIVPVLPWLPGALGIAGSMVLFVGCMLLIRETRLALISVQAEMDFAQRRAARHPAARED